MPSKIIQIIPAPPNMWARWEPTEEGEQEEHSPIVCLALMEDEDGFRWVAPMDICEGGEICDVSDIYNFCGVVLPKFKEATDEF